MTAGLPVDADVRICSACGTHVATALLVCPACARLVHADELKRLATKLTEAADKAGMPEIFALLTGQTSK